MEAIEREYRDFIDAVAQENVPLSGSLELTHRCNLSCRHCYQFPPRPGELDTARWLGLLAELAGSGCLFLAFTGGEPMLRKDIHTLLSAAAELNFVVTLQTNATTITAEDARVMGEMPSLRVDVSLYGARPRTHDDITGEAGSFLATRRALELLRENGVPVMLKVVVGGFNLNELEDISILADMLDAPAIFSSLIFPRNDRDPAPTALRLDDAGLERFIRFEMAYLPRYLSEIVGTEVTDVLDYVQRCSLGPGDPGGEGKRYCGGGRTVFAINPYGDVYPCVAFPLVVGNLAAGRFVEVWRKSPELLELRRKEMEIPERCGECSFLDGCGICRALSFQEQGETVAVSREKCRFTHALMKVLEDAKR